MRNRVNVTLTRLLCLAEWIFFRLHGEIRLEIDFYPCASRLHEHVFHPCPFRLPGVHASRFTASADNQPV